MIEERIVSILKADTNLMAAVSKIRMLRLEDSDELPSITYVLDKFYDSTFDGNSGLITAILETNVFSKTALEAIQANELLKLAMASVPGVTAETTVFDNVLVDREITTYDPEQENFQINTQFKISYSED